MSSPCEFYYACKGYFDKCESETMVLRKVAIAASAGFVKYSEFEKFWPLDTENVSKEFDKEHVLKTISLAKKTHNIK